MSNPIAEDPGFTSTCTVLRVHQQEGCFIYEQASENLLKPPDIHGFIRRGRGIIS